MRRPAQPTSKQNEPRGRRGPSITGSGKERDEPGRSLARSLSTGRSARQCDLLRAMTFEQGSEKRKAAIRTALDATRTQVKGYAARIRRRRHHAAIPPKAKDKSRKTGADHGTRNGSHRNAGNLPG